MTILKQKHWCLLMHFGVPLIYLWSASDSLWMRSDDLLITSDNSFNYLSIFLSACDGYEHIARLGRSAIYKVFETHQFCAFRLDFQNF